MEFMGIWGSHSNGYEQYYFLEYNAMHSRESQPRLHGIIFQKIELFGIYDTFFAIFFFLNLCSASQEVTTVNGTVR
jgi:hypothetical protein